MSLRSVIRSRPHRDLGLRSVTLLHEAVREGFRVPEAFCSEVTLALDVVVACSHRGRLLDRKVFCDNPFNACLVPVYRVAPEGINPPSGSPEGFETLCKRYSSKIGHSAADVTDLEACCSNFGWTHPVLLSAIDLQPFCPWPRHEQSP